jgi:hypothetical protein
MRTTGAGTAPRLPAERGKLTSHLHMSHCFGKGGKELTPSPYCTRRDKERYDIGASGCLTDSLGLLWNSESKAR